jgi:hypothetical protein
MLYNQDILERYEQRGPANNFDDFEQMMEAVLKNERSVDNFLVSGLASDFSGKYQQQPLAIFNTRPQKYAKCQPVLSL